MAEAKEASKTSWILHAYERKGKEIRGKRKISPIEANAEMRIYNLTMKVNRLELLKANIGLEMVSGFDEMQKVFR